MPVCFDNKIALIRIQENSWFIMMDMEGNGHEPRQMLFSKPEQMYTCREGELYPMLGKFSGSVQQR